MNGMSDLHLDWCGYDAAKYACENWHYSECVPSGKTLKIGVWEDDSFIGVIIYSRGANNHIAEPFGLDQTEVCELTRVALTDHNAPVTQMLSISRKLLTKKCPGLRLIVSYADPQQDHHGGIYQADNWTYIGTSIAQREVLIDGVEYHKRTVYAKYGTASVERLNERHPSKKFERGPKRFKYKYLYVLDDGIQPKVKAMSEPYP